ncbi:MAG: glutamate 5-kinase [Verrucomicrobiota bacterium]
MAKKRQRWVVKLGSGILTTRKGRIDLSQIRHLADQIAKLKKKDVEIIVVSSGAVSSGMTLMGLEQRPTKTEALQACATIGQPVLMKSYQNAFAKHELYVAQILLTYWDLDSRKLYQNTQTTLEYLLGLGNCVPIVNENDALSFEELEMLNRFGDNDRLSAHVALLTKADQLVVLSSIDGLLSCPDATGELIPWVPKVDSELKKVAGTTQSQRSVGGMISKLDTADMMIKSSVPMILANGRRPDVLLDIFRGRAIGTLFSKKAPASEKGRK